MIAKYLIIPMIYIIAVPMLCIGLFTEKRRIEKDL
jgi:hypothetical protein